MLTNDYRRRLGLPYDPSRYQSAIFEWVEYGSGDGVVEAVAGSGKTATLVACARLIDRGLFVAFNRHIADELKDRLRGTRMIANTVHSIGRAVVKDHLGYVQVEKRKYHWVITDYLIRQLGMTDKTEELVDARRVLRKLVDLARLNLVDPRDAEAVHRLCVHHDLKIAPELARHLPALLADGEDRARNGRHLIDFTDMIYLPVAWNLRIPQSPWVFVDECQDLNRCQLEFVLRCRQDGATRGRMLFVGDRYQSIYGFAGADDQSFLNIIHRTQATLLPLSICYRCPTSVLDLVRQYDHLSHVEARPGAPEGTVRDIAASVVHTELAPGDLVLCRVNAPLISLCIELIGRDVHARVKGRNIGEMLCEVLEALERYDGFQYDLILEFLEDWRDHQYQFLEDEDKDEGAYERIDDTVAAIETVIRAHPEVDSTGDLCGAIQSLFSDDRPAVWLSSVHKAKGLENPRIFILAPSKLPLVWQEQQDWEYEQELNLVYVAYTRAQEELVFIN